MAFFGGRGASAAAAASAGSSSSGGGGAPTGLGLGTFSGPGHGDAPASTAVTGAQGGAPQGHAQINKYAVKQHAGDSLDTPSLEKAMNDPPAYFTKKTPFGETAAGQVENAQESGVVPRTLSIRGDFGSFFGHVEGENPVTGDRTVFGDPEGFFALGAKGLASIIGGPIGAVSTFSSLVDLSQGLQDPISRMLGLSPAIFSKSTTPTTPTAPPKSTAPTKPTVSPVSLPKPQRLPKPPRQVVGQGPNILEEQIKKKKGGRIKKKNYSKGGGVRSAKY
jgi:hypothetical protein